MAHRTNATFIRVVGSELVQKYIGDGSKLVREIFEMARKNRKNRWWKRKESYLYPESRYRPGECEKDN